MTFEILVLLFTSPSCPGCVKCKYDLESHGINYRLINMETDEGRKKAQEFNIQSSPTTIVCRILVGHSQKYLDSLKKAGAE